LESKEPVPRSQESGGRAIPLKASKTITAKYTKLSKVKDRIQLMELFNKSDLFTMI
jgi:hypothetical protein